jgi:oxygen-dependent protoporphyrinogen oxidase
VRISRWPRSFPQYRPGHRARVDAIDDALRECAPGVFVCGAAYGGIGIPATILQARESAERVRRGRTS